MMSRLPVLFVALSLSTACMDDTASSDVSETTAALGDHNRNPALFPARAHPYGLSQERWSELLWTYIYAQPIDHNPFLDPTGAECGTGQRGPVWFLPAVPGSTLGTNVTRACTIPRHRAILLQLASIMNDYPCPDPTFEPAPGQTLYDFLIEPIMPPIDMVTGFEVVIDGVAIVDPLSYRRTSDDVFFFKGDPSLNPGFDTCVTGKLQKAVSDGYYLMFKPLSPGPHTIVVNGHDMHGTPVTLTEQLTIQ